MKKVIVLSGGMDSAVLLYHTFAGADEVSSCVSFNYGQRHKKELEYAAKLCNSFSIPHHIIDLWSSGFTSAIDGSTTLLESGGDVPEGHYAEETMKQTVVPNRNMVMSSIAASIAVAEKAAGISLAVHAGDHFVYPDCRPAFIAALNLAVTEANRGVGNFDEFEAVTAPFMYRSKAEIAELGLQYDVDFSQTWSCYKGGEIHCGRCGTCVERLEAIHEASIRYNPQLFYKHGSFDTTEYADTEYWRTVTKEKK